MYCDDCCYYIFDEDGEEYYCSADMDQDDFARLIQSGMRECAYFRPDDEYAVVRHQM